ncbi:MAG TPA: response regulator [Dongiaceae bacterium]|nr:response regulator [Dongiaceae bacterium]
MAKILLVEDDKSLREIYGVRLMAEGYEIVSAGDGEEALAMAIKERPDLIVSDVMMPKISGFDMLDILRSTSETKDVKVIMMTALSSDDQRARGEALGADRYLVKSQVGIEDVVRTVHDVLGDGLPSASPAPSFPPAATPAPAAAVAPAPAPIVTPVEPTPAPAAPITPAPAPIAAAPTPAPVAAPAPIPAPAPAAPVPLAPEPLAPATPAMAPPVQPAPAPASTPVTAPLAQPVVTPAPAPIAPAYSPAPVEPIPAPVPAPAPVTPTPAPAAPVVEPLPQPTAPFSTPAPASLGERVIQPLTAAPAPGGDTTADIAAQMEQALNGLGGAPAPATTPTQPGGIPPVPPAV